MNEIARARYALSSLTLFRGICEDPVVGALYRLLEATDGPDIHGFLTAYGRFFENLCAANEQLDLSEHLFRCLEFDDNLFARGAAARRESESALSGMDGALVAAARHDLSAVGLLMDLPASLVKACAVRSFGDDEETEACIEFLPDYRSARALPETEEALRTLTDFYRKNGCGRFARYGAFKWISGENGGRLWGVEKPDPIRLAELKGYAYERGVVVENTLDFLSGDAANNLLLYGDRGTGKSSTVKAVFNAYRDRGLRIIEVTKDCIGDFPAIVRQIAGVPLKFILFIDDLSFTQDDTTYSALKAVLEGGLASRPGNCVIYATTNRRHLVRESFSEREGDDVHAADSMQEKLSLADRFGITVTFSAPDQRLYFEIINALAKDRGLAVSQKDLERGAVQWALRFNGRSPRAARQYIDWAQSRLKNGLTLTDF